MTRLTALLVDQSPPSEPATLTVGTTMVRDGMVCELFDLQRAARLRLQRDAAVNARSDRRPIAPSCRTSALPAFDDGDWRGVFGAEPGSADRSGEFLAVAGAAVCLPADGTEVADYLVASGARGARSCTSRAVWSCDGGLRPALALRADRAGQHRHAVDAGRRCASSWRTRTRRAWSPWSRPTGLVGAALRQSPLLTGDG